MSMLTEGTVTGVKPLAGIRVCYVSSQEFSGATRPLKEARSVAEAGADVCFVGYEEYMPKRIRESGFRVVTVGHRPARGSENPVRLLRVAYNLTVFRVVDAWRKWRAPRQLAAAAASTRADVVQAVDLPGLEIGGMAAKRMGAKFVYDAHELWLGFVDNPDRGMSPQARRRFLDTERRWIGEADLVLAVSEPQGQRMAEHYGVPRPLILFNSPPKRVESARPVSDPVRLVFHGGLSADRNIDGLIRAMAMVDGVTLDVHGFSRTIDMGALQSLADDLGLQDRVRFHGAFDYDEVVELLQGYDVGVMAVKAVEENFEIALPNKLFDCICAGIAVAMGNTRAILEVVEETGCGVPLDPSTPETIAEGLRALVSDRDALLEMKRASVAAAPRYWWPEQAEKLVSALQRLVG